MPTRDGRPMEWFRVYTEITRDHKIRHQPVAQRWLWVAVLSLARQSPEPPKLLLSEGVPVTEAHLADEANVSLPAVRQAIPHYMESRMLHVVDGVMVVTNWPKRQFQSDDPTPRVKRFREAKRNVSSAVTETPPETETEVPSEPSEAESEAELTSSELGSQKTDAGGNRNATAREPTALVPVGAPNGSPQHGILLAAKIAFGHVGASEPERRKWRAAAGEGAKAEPALTPDEVPDLLAEWRRRGWKDPSLPGIVANLGRLRAPYEPGERPRNRRESSGDQIDRVFAEAGVTS